MMRTAPIAIVLCVASSSAWAQLPNAKTVTGLETCFRQARTDELTCASATNDPVQLQNCLQKAQKTQLDCLKQVPRDTTLAVAAPPPRETDKSDFPTNSIPPEAARPVPPQTSGANVSRGEAAKEPGKLLPASDPSQKSAAAVSSGAAARAADTRPPGGDTSWIVSETTSPVDYSPLLTATIRAPSDVKDAPTTLAIRCRGGRTELLVRTEGTWRSSRAHEIQVAYQIDDEPVVRLPWAASADGSSVSYRSDAAGLLQSLPEGGRLKITVLDGPDRQNQATFSLAGWDMVRDRIAAACKWTATTSRSTTNKVSSGRR
jgi:hypothetical protein